MYWPSCLSSRITGILTNSSVFHVSLLKLHQGPLASQPAHLPPTNVDHHPVVEPLSVLDWKWDNSVSPPTKLVLVQWFGLAPKDTPWDSYDALRESYNLVNKVILPGEGDVSNTNPPHTSRPKRCTKRSIYLDDYN